MTREEAIIHIGTLRTVTKDIPKYSGKAIDEALDMAIKALEAPPNDNWEGYSKRLWKSAYERGKADAEAEQVSALDKIRAEIDEQYDRVHPYNISCAEGLEMALEIIDKYMAESEDNADADSN